MTYDGMEYDDRERVASDLRHLRQRRDKCRREAADIGAPDSIDRQIAQHMAFLYQNQIAGYRHALATLYQR